MIETSPRVRQDAGWVPDASGAPPTKIKFRQERNEKKANSPPITTTTLKRRLIRKYVNGECQKKGNIESARPAESSSAAPIKRRDTGIQGDIVRTLYRTSRITGKPSGRKRKKQGGEGERKQLLFQRKMFGGVSMHRTTCPKDCCSDAASGVEAYCPVG